MAESTDDCGRIALRPVSNDDLSLLLLIYAGTRVDEMLALDWSPVQRGAFLRQQFEAQHDYYQASFQNAAFDIVLFNDQPAGRFYVDRRDDEIRIIDISVLPEYRGQGIGSRLIRELQIEARRKNLPICIHVANENAEAIRLYRHLGFRDRDADVDLVYGVMEWLPDTSCGFSAADAPSSEP